MLDKIKTAMRHNQALVLALAVVLILGAYFVGCESSVRSPINPSNKVNRVELQAELNHTLTLVEIAFADLDAQDAFKEQLSELAIVFASGGGVNPAGLVTSAIGLLGLGSIIDNRKKDALIKLLQNNVKELA